MSVVGWTVDPASVPVEVPRRILKATDRCDKGECAAAAFHRVIFSSGALDLCNHHFEAAPDSLLTKAVYHIDESWAV
ncbi:hypothetical protein J2X63_003193 [Agromyces sp. 3263]|uniref:DUF7455 domain-containing protein n=1 Tax=Agromyces sp. 3263 TaxID=2817750 RepID=UPI00285EAE44|nr:hypothetical protein [Agromyces sp. 3263]MDR6907485.1 hypothetical protein [Agromyces sp. 3263]